MSRRSENWLLVEWSAGGREVVHIKSLMSPLAKDMKIGDLITLRKRGEPATATLISRAKDRDQLFPKADEEAAGPSPKPEEEPRDYSPSGSSWAPSGDEDSGDSDQGSRKKIKLEQCKRQYLNRRSGKKVMTPSHRAPAVIPKIMQDSLFKGESSRKRSHNGDRRDGSVYKSLPDSTRRSRMIVAKPMKVTVDVRGLTTIKTNFRVLFKMIEELKRTVAHNFGSHLPNLPMICDNIQNHSENLQAAYHDSVDSIPIANEMVVETEECEETVEYENEEFNRSDDNVLITNKYDNQYNASVIKPVNDNEYEMQVNPGVRSEAANNISEDIMKSEYVPIGSGKTLIHKDRWRKINWKSYTVATRTLLLAVFPRRVLATHCLTGKKSPAFQNKPAKMCLNPKITSDVIMEVMDRFNVKENLVRGIITTKCADECKMWKQRAKKQSLSRSSSKSSNQENEPPAKGNFEDPNQGVTQ